MGLFSGLFQGRDNSADRAAEAQRLRMEEAIRRGDTDFGITEGRIGEQQAQLREDFLRQRGQTEAGFDPFIQAGEQGLGFLREGSTAEGFNRFLEDITQGSVFQSLRDEQERAGRGQLAASGQTGSGLALEEISRISPQLALQLEGQLFGRNQNLANMGFQGVQNRGQLGNQLTLGQGGLSSGLVDLESQLRDRLSGRAQGLISGIGGVESSGIIQSAAAKRARSSGLRSLIGGGIGSVVGGPAGGRIGSEIGGMF